MRVKSFREWRRRLRKIEPLTQSETTAEGNPELQNRIRFATPEKTGSTPRHVKMEESWWVAPKKAGSMPSLERGDVGRAESGGAVGGHGGAVRESGGSAGEEISRSRPPNP